MPDIRIMSHDDYHAAPGLNKSLLDELHRSPAHYKYRLDNPREDTPAMLWGRMFHSFILEPDQFEKTYAVLPEGIDRRTKEGKAIFAEWEESNPGRIGVNKPDLATLQAMRDSLYSHTRAVAALTGGRSELSLFWEHDGGIAAKCRVDYLNDHHGVAVDLKTCMDARADVFSRDCWKYRYHVQAPYYLDGIGAVTGERWSDFVFVCIEKEPPYAVAVYTADGEMVDQGRREYLRDLAVYRECMERDHWPAYADEVLALTLPAWAQDQD